MSGIDWTAAGGTLAAIGAVVSGAWAWLERQKRVRAETNAEVAQSAAEESVADAQSVVYKRLAERVEVLERAQLTLGQQLAEEVKLRMAAQEEAHRLRLRVRTLESVIRGLGAVIPPEYSE